MVRGRRVRAVVECNKNEICYSPDAKRRDRKNFNGKLKNGAKSHTITEFFQNVELEDPKKNANENGLGALCPQNIIFELPVNELLLNGFNKNKEPVFKENNISTPPRLSNNQVRNDVAVSPSTPHRIELRSEETDEVPKESEPILSKPPPGKITQKFGRKQENVETKTNNHKLTEYFPVRRSVRKTKKTVLEEKQRSLEKILRNNIEEGLEVCKFEGKGRGVIASKEFSRGDFVVEYSGDLIDIVEANKREEKYAQDQNTGCYMYYFRHNEQQYCVDATAESDRLGRLVNHSRNGNLITRTVIVDNKPRLVLIAKDNIKMGDELTYDYGDRSKESLRHHPWLAY